MLKQICTTVFSVAIVLAGPSVAVNNHLWTINITCPDGWMKAMNNCYLFNNKDQLTWQEARLECANLNSDLMVIANSQEQDWINIQTEEYSTDDWWIGLEYLEYRSSWGWVQYGGDDSLINWRNEPDNYDEQDCMAINEFGLFSDEYCRSQLGFICKYDINTDERCPTTINPWFMTDTSCYFISPLINSSLHLTWDQAKAYCTNMIIPGKTLQLLSVASSNEMQNLKNMLSSYDTRGILLPWWTGLNDKQTEGTYVWQNGSLADGNLIQWDVAPSTDRSRARNCGVMYQGGTVDDMKCDKRAHYVCEMPAVQEHLNLGCGSWLRADQSCYLLVKHRSFTWNQANDMCSRAGAHLLRINSLNEKDWVSDLNIGWRTFWTGLNRPHDTWTWDDHSSIQTDFVKWRQEPNNFNGNEQCAEILKHGIYNDRNCDGHNGYICEYQGSYEMPQACFPGWVRNQSSCYYFSKPNDTITWYEAKQRCNDLVAQNNQYYSAYRLSVNDVAEQAFINATLLQQPDGVPGYWTDLNDLKTKGFWLFNNDVYNPPNLALIPWAREPNNANGNEGCGAMIENGFVLDLNCEAKISFICEKPRTTVSRASMTSRISTLLILTIQWLMFYYL